LELESLLNDLKNNENEVTPKEKKNIPFANTFSNTTNLQNDKKKKYPILNSVTIDLINNNNTGNNISSSQIISIRKKSSDSNKSSKKLHINK